MGTDFCLIKRLYDVQKELKSAYELAMEVSKIPPIPIDLAAMAATSEDKILPEVEAWHDKVGEYLDVWVNFKGTEKLKLLFMADDPNLFALKEKKLLEEFLVCELFIILSELFGLREGSISRVPNLKAEKLIDICDNKGFYTYVQIRKMIDHDILGKSNLNKFFGMELTHLHYLEGGVWNNCEEGKGYLTCLFSCDILQIGSIPILIRL